MRKHGWSSPNAFDALSMTFSKGKKLIEKKKPNFQEIFRTSKNHQNIMNEFS